MQLFDKDKVYNFMGIRNPVLIASTICMIIAVVLLFTRGFNYGIDFSGGTLIQIQYDKKAPLDKIRASLEGVEELSGANVTEFGSDDEVIVRYSGSSDSLGSDPAKFISNILKDTGNFEIRRVDVVGPKVGDSLRKGGVMALSISLVLILVYIAARFEFRFAIAAIISEIHDILFVIGVILLLKISVNLDTLAALLTIIGYSLNDTIIVFDRIREGVRESEHTDLSYVINEAVSRTLSRTILTSFTTLASVVVLYFFGGDMIKDFSFIMIVGIVVGTYSSIFVASQALIWLKFDVKKYRANLAEKHRKEKEKEKMRQMYEQGTV